ncbi:ATP binding [Dimargaris xerosporica]|nr:ATP binding [Dimargaris xerosporica]
MPANVPVPPPEEFPLDKAWTLADVVEWLQVNDFSEYVPLFRDHQIHGETFFQLTHERLRQLGVPTVRDRARLLNASRKVLNRLDKDGRLHLDKARPGPIGQLGVHIPEREVLTASGEPNGYQSDSSGVPSANSRADSPSRSLSTQLATAALPSSQPTRLTTKAPTGSAPISPLSITSQGSADGDLDHGVTPTRAHRPLAFQPTGVPARLPEPLQPSTVGGKRPGAKSGLDLDALKDVPYHFPAHTRFSPGLAKAQYGSPPPQLTNQRAGGSVAPSARDRSDRPSSTINPLNAPEAPALQTSRYQSLSSDHLPLAPAAAASIGSSHSASDRNHPLAQVVHSASQGPAFATAPRAKRVAKPSVPDPLIASNLPVPAILEELALYPRSSSLNYTQSSAGDTSPQVVVPPRESSAASNSTTPRSKAKIKPQPINTKGRGVPTGRTQPMAPYPPPQKTGPGQPLTIKTRTTDHSTTPLPASHNSSGGGPYPTHVVYNTWSSGKTELYGVPEASQSYVSTSTAPSHGSNGGFFSTLFKPFTNSNRRKSIYGVTGKDESGRSPSSSSQPSVTPNSSSAFTGSSGFSPSSATGGSHGSNSGQRPLIFSVQVKLETDERFAIVDIAHATNGALVRERLCHAVGINPHSNVYTVWTVPPRPLDQPAVSGVGEGPLSDDVIWRLSQRANSVDSPNVRFIISMTRTPIHAPMKSPVPPSVSKQAHNLLKSHGGRQSPRHKNSLDSNDSRSPTAGISPLGSRAADLPLYPDDVFAPFKVGPSPRDHHSPTLRSAASPVEPRRWSDAASDVSDTGAVVSFERSSRWEGLVNKARQGDPSISLSELSMQELQRLATPDAPCADMVPPRAYGAGHRSTESSPISQTPPSLDAMRVNRSSTSSLSSTPMRHETSGGGQSSGPPSEDGRTSSRNPRRSGAVLTIDTRSGKGVAGGRRSGNHSQPWTSALGSPRLPRGSGSYPSSPAQRSMSESPGLKTEDPIAALPSQESPMSPRAWNALFPSHHIMPTEPSASAGSKPSSQASELWHTPMQKPTRLDSPAQGSPALTPLSSQPPAESCLDKSSELWSKPPAAKLAAPVSSVAAIEAAFQQARLQATATPAGPIAESVPAPASPHGAVNHVKSPLVQVPASDTTESCADQHRLDQAAPRVPAEPSLESPGNEAPAHRPSLESITSNRSIYYDAPDRIRDSRLFSDIPPLRASASSGQLAGASPQTKERLVGAARGPGRTNSVSSVQESAQRPSRSSSYSSTRSLSPASRRLELLGSTRPRGSSTGRHSPLMSSPQRDGKPRSSLSRSSSRRDSLGQWDDTPTNINWIQRPTTELMTKNLDTFFPHHDLDQPIIEPLPSALATSLNAPDSNNGGDSAGEPSDGEARLSVASEQLLNEVYGLSAIEESSETPSSSPQASAMPPGTPANDIEPPPADPRSLPVEEPVPSRHSPQDLPRRDSNVPLPRLEPSALGGRKRSVRFVVQQAQRRRTLLERRFEQRHARRHTPSDTQPTKPNSATTHSSESLTTGHAPQPPPADIQPSAQSADAPMGDCAPLAYPGLLRRKSTKLWGTRVTEVRPQKPLGASPRPDNALADQSAEPMLTGPTDSVTDEKLPATQASPGPKDRRNTLDPLIAVVGDKAADTKPIKIQWLKGKLIGKGSFGRVYHAINAATGEFMAVKQIDLPRTRNAAINAKQRAMIKALYDETEFLKDFDSENIVQYLGFELTGLTMNIFLEYVSGGSISSLIRQHGPLAEPVVHSFTRQTLLGLDYIHGYNVLHRDIKGANILVDDRGVCKISDFGISKRNDYELAYDCNSRMSLQGSIFWMAPEVVRASGYSAKIDIWSCGCLVIEMWTGKRPWEPLNEIQTMYRLGSGEAPPSPDDASADCLSLLERCFLANAEERPTASELIHDRFCQVPSSYNYLDYYGESSDVA